MIDHRALLHAIGRRLSFTVARRLLVTNGFPTGRSWLEIEEKIENAGHRPPGNTDGLLRSFIEALAVSDKLVALYRIEDSELRAVHKYAEALASSLPQHPFVEHFPFSLSEKSLARVAKNEALPVHVCEVGSATAIIYCTSRLIETREKLDVSSISENVRHSYSSVIGLRRRFLQSFNAIILPYFGNTIEVYSDFSSDMLIDSAEADHINLRNAFNAGMGKGILDKAINLFPAIKPLYASDEGDVAHLSHTVANGIKEEKMRGGKCVRRELFHSGGMAAVGGNFTPFKIGIHWEITKDEKWPPARHFGFTESIR